MPSLWGSGQLEKHRTPEVCGACSHLVPGEPRLPSPPSSSPVTLSPPGAEQQSLLFDRFGHLRHWCSRFCSLQCVCHAHPEICFLAPSGSAPGLWPEHFVRAEMIAWQARELPCGLLGPGLWVEAAPGSLHPCSFPGTLHLGKIVHRHPCVSYCLGGCSGR